MLAIREDKRLMEVMQMTLRFAEKMELKEEVKSRGLRARFSLVLCCGERKGLEWSFAEVRCWHFVPNPNSTVS